ncbi:hypothetical protein FDECE_13693 [Fusarium decemcellulare]|nr:hypothetical protein FDECE_13693 [Fusarium decemcellulare]
MHGMGAIRGWLEVDTPHKWLRWHPWQEWYDLWGNTQAKDELLLFFDHFLKGEDNGWDKTPKVCMAVLRFGHKEPQSYENIVEETFPIPRTTCKKLYLTTDGHLSPEKPGQLSFVSYNSETDDSAKFTYRFNETTQLVGLPKAVLFMSCPDYNDMDVYVLIEKLDPQGNVMFNLNIPWSKIPISSFDEMKPEEKTEVMLYRGPLGILRASHRAIDEVKSMHPHWPFHPHEKEDKIKPGDVVRLDIGIWAMGIEYEVVIMYQWLDFALWVAMIYVIMHPAFSITNFQPYICWSKDPPDSLTTLLSSHSSRFSQTMNYFKTPAFSARVEELLKKHHVPGLAIAIVQNDTIASAGYGHASLDPPKKCTADTLFDIASASKSLTAASIGLLVADEKYPDIQYEAPVSKILPDDFVMPTKELTEAVTVEDILSHRTGLPGHDSCYLGVDAKHPDDAKSITRNLRNLEMAAPLRTKWMYCNMMFTVATHIVETHSGLSFTDYLDKHFFQPLGMESSNLQPSRAQAKGLGDRIATGYIWKKDEDKYHGFQSPDCPEGQGAGSIVTSVNDYIKYVRAMMNQQDPITEDVYKGLIKSRISSNPEYKNLLPFHSPGLVAAGWEVSYYRGHMIVMHDGCIAGFCTSHFFLPTFKFGGAVFGNSEDAYNVIHTAILELIDDLLNIPVEQRIDWDKALTEVSGSEDGKKDEVEKVRQELCPGIKDSEPLEVPLSAYTGDYWSAGYRGMKVEVKDGKLFMDCFERSGPFTLTLDHVCGGNKFVAHLFNSLDGFTVPFSAEFKLENGKAVSMGLDFEEDLDGLIWFDRVE